jgi:hypothetical protein
MGSQLHHMANVEKLPSNKMTVWVKAMSEAIDNCVRGATKFAIAAVIDSWMKSKDYTQKKDSEGNTILPIRPIVVGGDDISVLCHVSYAMTFVEKVVEQFKELSKKHNETFLKEHGYDLWPATGGKLSISAGVLFCPVNLPLHTAIEYAESLLASAKSRGRKDPVVDEPSLECIDWEHITDSIIDTPSARRQREMIYKDTDSGREVHLTNRPCTINEFQGIKELAEKYGSETDAGVPATIRHKVLPAMRKGLYDRLAFIAEIAKHQPILAAHLSEEGYEISPEKTKWDYSESGKQKTPVIDALLLLEEIQRMSKETNNVK